jgi:hypothetical protein
MSKLETQYRKFLLENPDSKFTFEEWGKWKFLKIKSFIENIESDDWDVTLQDGLENEPPYISDDFQIGPDGAYEHIEREIDFQAVLKTIIFKLKTSTYNKGDISDIGNEIGIAVGIALNDMKASEISEFIFGLKHGISLTNGTH